MPGILEKMLSFLLESVQQRHAVANELAGLKRRLLMTMVSNHLDVPLHAIQEFFLRNPLLLEKCFENRLFMARWLMDPYRQAFGSVPGMWTKERYDQLRSDVTFLRA
jgi:hypothetical protein